jgi:hypothetical protein
VSENDTVSISEKSNDITEEDLEKVKNIMLLKFTTPDIPAVMAITFRDFKKLDEIIEIEGYKDRKEAIIKLIDAYKLSPISENREAFLSNFEIDDIKIVTIDESDIKVSIDMINDDKTDTLEMKFRRNEDGQWYMVGDLESLYEILNRQGYLD